MYYPISKNKGADQLCSYCTADLRLCFRIGKNPVFLPRGSPTLGYLNRKKFYPIDSSSLASWLELLIGAQFSSSKCSKQLDLLYILQSLKTYFIISE